MAAAAIRILNSTSANNSQCGLEITGTQNCQVINVICYGNAANVTDAIGSDFNTFLNCWFNDGITTTGANDQITNCWDGVTWLTWTGPWPVIAVTVSSDGTILYGDSGWGALGGVESISITMDYLPNSYASDYDGNPSYYASSIEPWATTYGTVTTVTVPLNLDSSTSTIAPAPFGTFVQVPGETEFLATISITTGNSVTTNFDFPTLVETSSLPPPSILSAGIASVVIHGFHYNGGAGAIDAMSITLTDGNTYAPSDTSSSSGGGPVLLG